jgi:hypothetical protein
MLTSNHGGGGFGSRLIATNRLALAVCCVLAAAGTFSTIHPSTDPKLLVSFVTSDPCQPGRDQGATDCLTPLPGIHIDPAPAFACLTSAGTLGDRLVGGVCTAEVVKPATGPQGRSTDTTAHPTVR